ncbi:hypothetical protein KC963_02425 [Candidatus Saccharibacteria bacterium]|nr:hypothetical protein [Candidatus Saccharibacteria bacterium]
MSREKERDEDMLRLQVPFFNNGLSQTGAPNTCFINSLLIALRSLYCFVRLLLTGHLFDFYHVHGYEDDRELLYSLIALLRAMLQDTSRYQMFTSERRLKFVRILQRKSDQLGLHGHGPVEMDEQGDPSELIVYMVNWLQESLQQVCAEHEQRDSGGQQASQRSRTREEASRVANQLRNLLNEFVPAMSDFTRCPAGHVSGQVQPTLIQLPLQKYYSNITECLADYFSPEIVYKSCTTCRLDSVEARKASRLSQLPEHVFVIAFTYNRNNHNVSGYL